MHTPDPYPPGLVQRAISKTQNRDRDQDQQEGRGARAAPSSQHPPPAEDDDEDDFDPGPPQFAPKRKRRRDPVCNEANGYLLMALIVAIVVFVSFKLNKHEMHELRAVHGHDTRKPMSKDIWWHNALIYQIYPRSFQDSNGDGYGDLNGIKSRLSHLMGLNVNIVMLNSVMEAPPGGADRGVSDFMTVDSLLGTQADFDDLIKELHDHDMRLIIEFIINHTSDKHRWFQESRKGGANNPYIDYYIWSPGLVLDNGTHVRPNNWLSRYGGSMWSWDDVRGEFYLHQYGSNMPDLNHRCPQVREEFIKIFEKWLVGGVDGIYLEGVQAVFEVDDLFLDEPDSEREGVHQDDWMYLDHIFTDDQPEIHEFLATWREQIDAYMHRTDRKVFLGVEVMDDRIADVMYYYQTGADAPFSLLLADLATDCDGYCIHDMVDRWLLDVPESRSTFWVVSNHEVGRLSSRKGHIYKGVLAMLQLLLPGGAVIYYGDEIGMEHHRTSPTDVIVGEHFSHRSHNGSRTPMQWNSAWNAGFSTAEKTWIPVYKDYESINVEVELSNAKEGHTLTTLQLYRRVVMLRNEGAFKLGRIHFVSTTKEIFSFMRFLKDDNAYFIVLNFGDTESHKDYFHSVGVLMGRVVCHVTGMASRDVLGEDDLVDLSNLTLAPGEGMVLRLF